MVNIAMAAARVSMSGVALDGWFAAGFIILELSGEVGYCNKKKKTFSILYHLKGM